jgi:hypothetical protein
MRTVNGEQNHGITKKDAAASHQEAKGGPI